MKDTIETVLLDVDDVARIRQALLYYAHATNTQDAHAYAELVEFFTQVPLVLMKQSDLL